MLATQNYGNLFTEKDREILSSICDDCNPIPFDEIETILKQEYNDLNTIFSYIDPSPIGSASVSQVHRAILSSGEEVAIKIRRTDITNGIDQEIKKIKKIMHRFGKFLKFGNYTGGDHALNLYLKWIMQETDFVQERKNIKTYQEFAASVNGKIPGTKRIYVPKVYEPYCTDNIIVMEYIKTPTVNKMELTEVNKNLIITAVNSYIKSSFWALLHDKPIIFHGDPHSGNVCVDEEGNIYFLDMGLLSVLNEKDAQLCREFFLTAYVGDYEKLYNMLIIYGNMSEAKKELFKEECKKYCNDVRKKELTYYFIDMVNICLNYEFVPPDFLFSMAKAFICLNGINKFTNNPIHGIKLLQAQVLEFVLQRSLKDGQDIIIHGLKVGPKILDNIVKYGLVQTVAMEVSINTMQSDLYKYMKNLQQLIRMIKLPYVDNESSKQKQL